MRSLEARLKRVEQRLEESLAPKKNRPFLLSDLPEEKAAELVKSYKKACEEFFGEFGGEPLVEFIGLNGPSIFSPPSFQPLHTETKGCSNAHVLCPS